MKNEFKLDKIWYEIGIVSNENFNKILNNIDYSDPFYEEHIKYMLLEKFIIDDKLKLNNYKTFIEFLELHNHISITLAILYIIMHSFNVELEIFEHVTKLILKLDSKSSINVLKAQLRRNYFYGFKLPELEFLDYIKNEKLHYSLLEITDSIDRLLILYDTSKSKKLKNIIKTKITKMQKLL